VILSNREYRVLKHNLDAYRQRFDIASNKPYPHMDLTHPTLGFAAMAEGMGVSARQITDPEELADAVRTALAVGGPQLLDVVISGLETAT
jgi:benzoylformate decarboxylase